MANHGINLTIASPGSAMAGYAQRSTTIQMRALIIVICLLAVCLFVGSFFLPSLRFAGDALTGYDCAMACFNAFRGESAILIDLYHFSFTFSNIMMILLPVPMMIAVLRRNKIPAGVKVIQMILLGHVVSWLMVNVVEGQLWMIGIGYYVWLLSMVLMFWCTLANNRRTSGFTQTPDGAGDP